MKSTPTLLSALTLILALSGCKVSLSGEGTLVDAASKKSQPITVDVFSANKGRECEVSIALSDSAGQEILALQTDAFVTESADFAIDTSKSGCEPDSKVVVVATAKHRITGTETVEKLVHCGYTNPQERTFHNGGAGLRQQRVRMIVKTIVTDVQGEIRDRETGALIRTFSATSEPRVEAVSTETAAQRANCQ